MPWTTQTPSWIVLRVFKQRKVTRGFRTLEQELYKYFVLEVFKYLRLSEKIAGLRYKLRSAEYLGEGGGVGSPLKIQAEFTYWHPI